MTMIIMMSMKDMTNSQTHHETESHRFGISRAGDWGYIGASYQELTSTYASFHGEHGEHEEHGEEHEGETMATRIMRMNMVMMSTVKSVLSLKQILRS